PPPTHHPVPTRRSSDLESPIKGTIPLTSDPAELAASAKDVAENIMIVDLVRHDLGQVAVTGGVRVTDLLAVRPAPGVWHLVSEVDRKSTRLNSSHVKIS